ncbi:MAG: hypothetical protein RL553_2155 [Planctomycetota bacterium]|jgi:hypothetical protein
MLNAPSKMLQIPALTLFPEDLKSIFFYLINYDILNFSPCLLIWDGTYKL